MLELRFKKYLKDDEGNILEEYQIIITVTADRLIKSIKGEAPLAEWVEIHTIHQG